MQNFRPDHGLARKDDAKMRRTLPVLFSTWIVLLLALLASRPGGAQTAPGTAFAVAPQITGAIDEGNLLVLHGNTHLRARAEFDRGPVPADLHLSRILLVLRRSAQQEAALRQLIDDLHDPSSLRYHQWLTPEQFGGKFGPAPADIDTIVKWLQSHGFGVSEVAAGRGTIEFSGTVAQVEEAFHTQIHHYLVGGELHMANASDPQIPAALAPVVAGVNSLHDFFKRPIAHSLKSLAETGGAPEFNASGGGNLVAPGDFWTIYNATPAINAGTTGAGVTIGIVGRSDILASDIATFRTTYLPGYPNNFHQIINGADPGDVSGDDSENTLDVEWAGATAPDATIKLVVSETTETTDGVDLSAQYIVDHNLADVVSASYGECEAALGATEDAFLASLWEQAAAQGITAAVSAGDEGSAGCDNPDASNDPSNPTVAQYGLQVNGLASTPYNVAVGGNEFYNESSSWNSSMSSIPLPDTSAIGYIAEEAWNESCAPDDPSCTPATASLWAGSGGVSSCVTFDAQQNCLAGWPKPSWQSGVYGIPSDGARDLPDVSFTAAGHDAYLIEWQGALYSVGGTSVSSPSFAGVMALIDQKTGIRQGQANYVLYQLAANEYGSAGAPNATNLASCNGASGSSVASTCLFYDVTTGTNAVPCAGGTPNCSATSSGTYGILSGYNAAPGYDLTTGLGSLNITNLVNEWTSVGNVLSLTVQGPGTVAIADNSKNSQVTCAGACQVSFTNGASATLSATPSPGATFTGWSGACTGTGTCSLTMNSGLSVTATFTNPLPVLTSLLPVSTPAGGAAFLLTVNGSSFDGNSVVRWNGSSRTTTYLNSSQLQAAIMSADISVAGSVPVTVFSPTPGGGASGTQTFTVTAAAGTITLTQSSLTFSSQTTGTTSTAQAVALQNTGTAALNAPTIAISGTNAGDFGQSSNCQSSLGVGNSCSIAVTFTPTAAGTRTATLTVTDSNASNSPQTVALSGTGAIATYALTVATSGSGTVTSTDGDINCGSACNYSYASGTSVTLNASAASGWTFSGWSGACSGTGSCVVAMTQAQSATATFVQITYALTVSTSGSGTVTSTDGDISCGSSCNHSYTSGTSVTLNASAASGWTFSGWSGACSGTGSCAITMTQAQSATATFVASTSTLALTPSNLTFSSQTTGTTSTAQAVGLQNSGTAALNAPTITISGTNAGDFGQSSNCQSSIGAGNSCSIAVTFTPTAAGTRTATLTVTDSNASNSGQTVALSGTGAIAATTTTLTVAPNPTTVGTTVVFTANVTGGGSTGLTGGVTFNDGSTQLGTGTLNSSGVATYSSSSLSVGMHTVTAVYSGNATSAASTSPAVSVAIQDFSLSAATTSTVTVTAGQSGSATIPLSPVNGFTGTITFVCSVPATMTEASCSAAPVQIAGASTVDSTVTVTTTAAHHVAALRRHSTWMVAHLGVGFFGLVLWGIPYRRRRRIALIGAVLAILLLTACGGGGSSSSGSGSGYTDAGTPAGTYTLTLAASSGAASHTMNLSVTVQ